MQCSHGGYGAILIKNLQNSMIPSRISFTKPIARHFWVHWLLLQSPRWWLAYIRLEACARLTFQNLDSPDLFGNLMSDAIQATAGRR